MINVIKWFVLLLYKDMQDFKMDECTNESIKKRIKEKTKEMEKKDV